MGLGASADPCGKSLEKSDNPEDSHGWLSFDSWFVSQNLDSFGASLGVSVHPCGN